MAWGRSKIKPRCRRGAEKAVWRDRARSQGRLAASIRLMNDLAQVAEGLTDFSTVGRAFDVNPVDH